MTTRLAYHYLLAHGSIPLHLWWAISIWKWHVPVKLKCFYWLIVHNKILTWDNLCRCRWQGSRLCPHCLAHTKSTEHLLIQCSFARNLWHSLCVSLHIDGSRNYSSIKDCMIYWATQQRLHKTLPIFICWGLWKSRNSWIFEGIKPNIFHTGLMIISYYKEY